MHDLMVRVLADLTDKKLTDGTVAVRSISLNAVIHRCGGNSRHIQVSMADVEAAIAKGDK